MYVNTGGGGKTQQQQPLQNQTNASVRHNSPYPQSHAQQQPHYEHPTQVTFVYPCCNVAPPTHGNTGGNNVAVGGGQPAHVLFQPQHQPQSQPHPTQQQVGLHSTEQTLHYFAKSAPMPAHHLHHPQQQHTQLRSMIATVSHQRQPYMVPPSFFPFPHALLPQQSRASILTNAASQHAVAAASGGSMATQLQSTAPRSVPPNGPTTYVPPSYCNPPLLMGAAPAAVTPQPASMLTAATGLVQQPSLQAYAHMSGGLPTAPPPSAPMNMQNVGLGTGTSSNTEHTTSIHTNNKLRRHAIPIMHPITMEIVPVEDLVDPLPNSQPQPQPQSQPQPQFQPQTQIKMETNVESVSIQTDNDKSLTASITSDLSDIVPPTCSHSSSPLEADEINVQLENEECDYDIVKQESVHAVEATTLVSVLDANTTTKSFQSHSESLKNCAYEDPNDTDADTNEHELDNEDIIDVKDGNLSVSCTEHDLSSNLSKEQPIEEVPKTDLVILQAGESDTEHTTETEIKSNEEPFTISAQTSLDRNDEVVSKEIQEDLKPSTTAFVITESKRNKKNRKGKNKERNQKNVKQQQNKSNNISTQKDENNAANANIKAAATAAASDNKAVESKTKNINTNLPKKEDLKPTFIRYSLAELKALAKSSESRKTPVVPCQKGDCIAQLFVARQLHPQYLSHQSQNASTINLQHHVQQSYHQMDFNESMEFVTGKRRSVGAGGGPARKHQEHHLNLAPTGNNNPGLQSTSGTTAIGCASMQMQKKMPVIRINLSLNEEIKLSECKNAWQPKFLANNSNNNAFPSESCKNDNDDLEDVLKKVRGILNKLTSENFDVLLKEMTSININTAEKMQKIMLLIFEKTVSEPNFAPTYAKFCKVLFDEIKAESKEGFNALLIKRLENEFDSNVNNADAKERKLQEIMQKLNDATDPQEKIELQAELEHQEYQFRRRAWGTVRFIGEMFKLRSLSANRVILCLESLLDHGNEEKLEYMCKLLTTVGNLLESNESKSFINVRMNNIFAKMQAIVKEAKEPGKKKIKICSRVRFMIQDLIDLRSKNWGQASYAQSSQVATQRRRLTEDKSSNLATGSANSYERGSSQRTSFGNNNRQNQSRTKESGNYFMQNTKSSKSQYLGQREQQSIDLKKLNFSRGDDSLQSTTKLGTSSVYMWRTISGRTTVQSNESHQNDRSSPTFPHKYPQKQHPSQPQPQYWGPKISNFSSATKPIAEPCSGRDNKQLLNHLMEEYLDCLPSHSSRWQEEVFDTWQKTNNSQQLNLVHYILIDYIHLPSTGRLERNSCANIFIYLMRKNVFNKTTFTRAYDQFAKDFPDLLIDVPNGFAYVFHFLGPFIHEHLLTFTDIWYTNWRSNKLFTEGFLNALIVYFIKEFGANYMRTFWNKELKHQLTPIFKNDHLQLRQFLVNHKLQFLYDNKAKPEIGSTNANSNSSVVTDQHLMRLETLLSSPNDSNLALDYINTNVNINSHFLKKLTRFLCCYYATTTKSRTSSATASKNSSTCSNTSSTSSTKNTDSTATVHLNTEAFRNTCLPVLRLCLDGHEYHELACLDSIVNGIQNEYDIDTAFELISGIFDLLYEFDVIAKESFEKWYQQRFHTKVEHKDSKIGIKKELWLDLKSYMEKLL